jgi:hypothetical protein
MMGPFLFGRRCRLITSVWVINHACDEQHFTLSAKTCLVSKRERKKGKLNEADVNIVNERENKRERGDFAKLSHHFNCGRITQKYCASACQAKKLETTFLRICEMIQNLSPRNKNAEYEPLRDISIKEGTSNYCLSRCTAEGQGRL